MIADKPYFELMLNHRGFDEVDEWFTDTLTGDQARAWREYKSRYIIEVEPKPAVHDWTQLDMIEAVHGDPLNTPFQLYCATEIIARAATYDCHVYMQPDRQRSDAHAWPPGVWSRVHKRGCLHNTLPAWIEFVCDTLSIDRRNVYMCHRSGLIQHSALSMDALRQACQYAERQRYMPGSESTSNFLVKDAMVFVCDRWLHRQEESMSIGLSANPIDGVLAPVTYDGNGLMTHRHLNSDRCCLRDIQGFDWRAAWV